MAYIPQYKSAAVSAASSGDNTLVAAVSGQTIRVYRIAWTLAAGTIKFKDGSTDLTGAMSATSGVLESTDGTPLFVVAGAFIANLSGANQLSGCVWCEQSA